MVDVDDLIGQAFGGPGISPLDEEILDEDAIIDDIDIDLTPEDESKIDTVSFIDKNTLIQY